MKSSDVLEQTWPRGESEAAQSVRGFDWSKTCLGPCEDWPERLKASVDLALNCAFPMVILWGSELIQIYNDGYRKILGPKHPAAMGQATRDCWPEVWYINEPIYTRVWLGQTLTFQDQLYPILSGGRLENAYFTLCYSPLPDGQARTAGILVTVLDTTAHVSQRMRAEQRAEFLMKLHVATQPLVDPEEITSTILRLMCDHLAVDRCVYCVFEADEDSFEIASETLAADVTRMGGRHKLTSFGEDATRRFRSGQLTVVDDVENDLRTADTWSDYNAMGIKAHIAMPLLKAGRLVAAVGIHQLTPRVWRADEAELVGIIANRCWESVERARAEQELRRQWHTFDTALSHTVDFTYIFDLQGRFTYVNKALLDLWEKSLEDAQGRTFAELDYPPELAARLQTQIEQVIETRGMVKDETAFTGPTGETRHYEYILVPILAEEGAVTSVAGSTRDITEIRKNEERMRSSLAEREVLLKEIHHRVKNNLQVIVSLLNLQANQLPDGAAVNAFRDTQSRVRAIARIHETLYSSSDLAQVEFGHYARFLIQDVLTFYGTPDRIQLKIVAEDMVLDIDQAVPLGLILNELVTNSLKHAFPDGRTGSISVSLSYLQDTVSAGQTLDDAMARLCVRDDGVGFSPGFDFATCDSMGMYLVRILARQLHAQVVFQEDAGASCSLSFPINFTESRGY